ncbi:MAG: ZTL protein [Betaproteobacteria bacterium]|nr:MAG: ZTL protein [Betaproteobacteria bacterium]
MASRKPARIYVLAGVNGAGKSSIGGAAFRAFGGDYYNPDEAARALMAAHRGLEQTQANAAAWQQGKALLERAIAKRLHFAFETTLGASTIPRLLEEAAAQGIAVHVWYAGLASPELHVARVRARVRRGGHDIAETDIRRRYEHSRLNLIRLLPSLAALRLYDNSAEADPASGLAPSPRLLLHMQRGRILGPEDLSATPNWAKPIVAAALI